MTDEELGQTDEARGQQLELPGPVWVPIKKGDKRALALADRHYSRQTPGSIQFVPPGRCVVLLTPCARAVWAVVQNMDPTGKVRWRNTMFRNEGAGLSSELIRAAVAMTYQLWRAKYGELPALLTTEIDAGKISNQRNPGYCFKRAGWRHLYTTEGAKKGRSNLMVFGAPR